MRPQRRFSIKICELGLIDVLYEVSWHPRIEVSGRGKIRNSRNAPMNYAVTRILSSLYSKPHFCSLHVDIARKFFFLDE